MGVATPGCALWRALVRSGVRSSHPHLRSPDGRQGQHNDGDSRTPGESPHCRLHRDGADHDVFDLGGLMLDVGVHFEVRTKARRRRNARPALLFKNEPKFLCFSSSQSFKTPVSHATRASRWRRDCSYRSAERARTARMNFSRKKLTSAAVAVSLEEEVDGRQAASDA